MSKECAAPPKQEITEERIKELASDFLIVSFADYPHGGSLALLARVTAGHNGQAVLRWRGSLPAAITGNVAICSAAGKPAVLGSDAEVDYGDIESAINGVRIRLEALGAALQPVQVAEASSSGRGEASGGEQVASTQTVFAMFTAELGVEPGDDQGGWKEMPVDSACGDDCALAITAAKSLLGHIEAAHGNHRPDLKQHVIDAAKSVVDVYIYG